MASKVIPIGKYKGKRYDEVARTDPQYLSWMAQNTGPVTSRAAQSALDRRATDLISRGRVERSSR